jgi:hypothetical protein
VPLLPDLPKSIAKGLVWVLCSFAVASWAGWLELPYAAIQRQREETREAEQRARNAERTIFLLQYQQMQTSEDLKAVKAKLDEMAKVLYSLERRSR